MRSCAPSLHLPCPPSFPVSLAIAIQISQSRVEPRIEKSFRKLREKTSEQWISDYVETQRTANLEVYDAFGRKVSEPTTRPQRALINRNCSRLLRRVELLERRSGFKRSFLQRFFFLAIFRSKTVASNSLFCSRLDNRETITLFREQWPSLTRSKEMERKNRVGIEDGWRARTKRV